MTSSGAVPLHPAFPRPETTEQPMLASIARLQLGETAQNGPGETVNPTKPETRVPA